MDLPTDLLEPTAPEDYFVPQTFAPFGDYSITDDQSTNRDDSGLFSDPDLTMLSPVTNVNTFGEEFFTDLTPMIRDRRNTWPTEFDWPMKEAGFDAISPPAAVNTQQLSIDTEVSIQPNSESSGSPPEMSSEGDSPDHTQVERKTSTRRNAWGNMSYADMITEAILSSPDKRLTLSQVYEWMIQNVEYFRDKGECNSSAGWKVSLWGQPGFYVGIVMDDQSEMRGRCYTWPMQQYAAQPPTAMASGTSSFAPSSSSLSSLSHCLPSVVSFGSTDVWGHHHPMAVSDSHLYPPPPPQFSAEMSASTSGLWPSKLPIGPIPNDEECFHQPPKKKRIRRRNPEMVSQKKPNPWGEDSYSDLIARALDSAPEGRLKLNEIYQWFSENVPYFRERSSQEQAAGWKNSIRHNLSLHSRFMRIQNEGAGKSSWWVINPDAKSGKHPRRRALTMEPAIKNAMEKKRRGARKRLESGNANPPANQMDTSREQIFTEFDDQFSDYGSFRSRTQSAATSTIRRMSPTSSESVGTSFDELKYSPWNNGPTTSYARPSLAELSDRTDQIRLDGPHPSSYAPPQPTFYPMETTKSGGDKILQQYHELGTVEHRFAPPPMGFPHPQKMAYGGEEQRWGTGDAPPRFFDSAQMDTQQTVDFTDSLMNSSTFDNGGSDCLAFK